MNGRYILLTAVLMILFIAPACIEKEVASTRSTDTDSTSGTPVAAVSFTLEPIPSDLKKPDLTRGQSWEFSYLEGGIAFGSDKYKVTSVPDGSGSKTYSISSDLKLEQNSLWGEYEIHATLTIEGNSNPVTYNSTEKIGCG